MSFGEIGNEIGCSSQRARELYQKAKFFREYHEQGEAGDPLYGLSVRTRNVCLNAGLTNRDKIEDAIKDGRMHPDAEIKFRHYGWKSHAEIYKWLGLPEPIKPQGYPKSSSDNGSAGVVNAR